jgi:hypothetical protein
MAKERVLEQHLYGLTSLNVEGKTLHMIIDVSTEQLQQVITLWQR